MRPLTFLALAVSLPAQQTPLSIPALADATVYSHQAGKNFGSAAELGLAKDKDASGTLYFMRSYLRFDLAALKGRPFASKAEIRVHEARTKAAGGLPVAAYQVSQAWTENTVTWTSKPANTGPVLSSVKIGDNFNRGWKAFDITALVRAWQSGTANHGVVLRLEREITAGAYRPGWCESREASNAQLRPYLYVETKAVEGFGKGCGPVATWPRLSVVTGTPKVGTAMVIQGSLLAPSKSVLVAVGLSNKSYLGVPLPYTLDPSVFPACQLLVSLELMLGTVANSNGQASLPVAIPVIQGLAGSQVFVQMASPGNPAYMTEGLAIRFY